jgi:hypothetical protein
MHADDVFLLYNIGVLPSQYTNTIYRYYNHWHLEATMTGFQKTNVGDTIGLLWNESCWNCASLVCTLPGICFWNFCPIIWNDTQVLPSK